MPSTFIGLNDSSQPPVLCNEFPAVILKTASIE